MTSLVPVMIETSPVARLLTWATRDSENVLVDSSVAAASDATASATSLAAARPGTAARTPIVATLADVCPINPRRVSFAILLSLYVTIFASPYDQGLAGISLLDTHCRGKALFSTRLDRS